MVHRRIQCLMSDPIHLLALRKRLRVPTRVTFDDKFLFSLGQFSGRTVYKTILIQLWNNVANRQTFWDPFIQRLLYAYSTEVHCWTKATPFSLMMSCHQPAPPVSDLPSPILSEMSTTHDPHPFCWGFLQKRDTLGAYRPNIGERPDALQALLRQVSSLRSNIITGIILIFWLPTGTAHTRRLSDKRAALEATTDSHPTVPDHCHHTRYLPHQWNLYSYTVLTDHETREPERPTWRTHCIKGTSQKMGQPPFIKQRAITELTKPNYLLRRSTGNSEPAITFDTSSLGRSTRLTKILLNLSTTSGSTLDPNTAVADIVDHKRETRRMGSNYWII